MPSWFTSRLKAAEQLLQLIDQQAAISKEQLEKADADRASLLTPEVRRGGRFGNDDQPSLNLPSQSGDGKGRHLKRSPSSVDSRQNEVGPGPASEDGVGKRECIELLGSTGLSTPQSGSRVFFSSIGSSDFGGTQNVFGGGSQRGFDTAGKAFVSSHETDECTPGSKTSLGGAGDSHPSSLLASRVKGPSKYMVEVRPSDLRRKADNYEVLDDTTEHDLNEHHMDAVTHNVSDITSNLFIQPANEDEEVTESEISLAEGTKYLKNTDWGVSARNIVEYAPTFMLGQTTVLVDKMEGRDTPAVANSDTASLADAKETQKIRMRVGDSTHRFAGDKEAVIERHGTGRHSDDEGSGGDSEGSSVSGSGERSECVSGGESDSEYEDTVRRLRNRKTDLSEWRAAKFAALEVARAEEEKENLEKLLSEWEERQVKEAEELNLTMKEISEAVEVERQRHAIIRREGLSREAQLEARNHELAKALAAAERTLEEENARGALARSQVESREIFQSDLQRKILHLQYRLKPTQPQEIPDSKIERERVEEHFAHLIASFEQFQSKAKYLEEKIFLARDAHYTPSVMELELESRLNQLTDHLIQRQSQVEALSTEKATLHFRLETISHSLRMDKSAAQSRASKRKSTNPVTDLSTYHDDLECGWSKPYSSKDKYFLMGTDSTTILNRTAVSKLARQVDSVFLMGARVLQTSSSTRGFAAFYIFLLHSWVLFIYFMHVRYAGSGSTSEVASVQAAVNELSVSTQRLHSIAFNE